MGQIFRLQEMIKTVNLTVVLSMEKTWEFPLLTVMQFYIKDKTTFDTQGHEDFSEDTYRT